MSPHPISLDDLIRRARHVVRRDVALAVACAALLVVPAVLALAWLLADVTPWVAPSPVPLALEAVGVAMIIGIALFGWRRWQAGTEESDLASTADTHAGLAPGSVLAMLELGRGLPAGTSPELYHRENAMVGGRFVGARASTVSGTIGQRARRRVGWVGAGLAGLTAVTAMLGFTSPDRTGVAWTPLLHPLAHLSSPPLPPLAVEPGDAEVLRGGDLEVRVRAEGRFAITVAWRAEGDILRRETVSVVDDRASALVTGVDAPTVYWVEAPDGARSRQFTITPLDPLLVTELSVVVRYPAYVSRSPDRFSTEIPPLELPQGTSLVIEGRTTRELSRGSLDGASGSAVRLDIDGATFRTTWRPGAGGVYEWKLTGEDGSALMTPPSPLEITIVPDSPPDVEITFPGRDTLIDAARMQAIAADARDDYGIARAALVSWRVSAAGRADPPVEVALPIASGDDRILARGVLDLRERDVLPGDTIKYFVRVTDNSPAGQTAVSTTFSLYLPGASELRERVTEEADDLVREAEQLANRTRDLNEATRNLERRTEASNSRRNDPATRNSGQQSGTQGSLGFRESELARQILDEQP
jgi:hypothetical protein